MDLLSCVVMNILISDNYAIGNAKAAEVKYIKVNAYDSSDINNNVSIYTFM